MRRKPKRRGRGAAKPGTVRAAAVPPPRRRYMTYSTRKQFGMEYRASDFTGTFGDYLKRRGIRTGPKGPRLRHSGRRNRNGRRRPQG